MTRMRSAVKAVADSAGFYLALSRFVSLAQREMWNQGPKKRRLKALASTARQVKLVPVWRSDRWRSVVFRENCRRARVRVGKNQASRPARLGRPLRPNLRAGLADSMRTSRSSEQGNLVAD